MMKPCATAGCPEIVGRGTSYCETHAPPPWEGRSGNTMPKGWSKIRRRIMQRDRYECQVDITGAGLICSQPATEVDHLLPRSLGGSEDQDNLRAICHPHHLAKTKTEATAARAQRRNA